MECLQEFPQPLPFQVFSRKNQNTEDARQDSSGEHQNETRNETSSESDVSIVDFNAKTEMAIDRTTKTDDTSDKGEERFQDAPRSQDPEKDLERGDANRT